MRAAFCTLGCKVNSYDSAMMAQCLKDAGYEIVDFEEKADVYIINSCTVTGTGDKKSRQMVNRARKNNPQAIVCLAGCMAQVHTEDVKKLDADLILGTAQKTKIAEFIEKAKEKKVVATCEAENYEDCFKTLQTERTRGFLKIQDGCDRFCTYCIIPYARGKSRSRDMTSIISEAKELVKDGYKELVLTGIHIASYGKENGSSLLEVIQNVAKTEGVKRIRLGSLEPMILTEKFCMELGKIEKMCPSFHISMQSGCDKTLKAMGRRYTSQEYAGYVSNVRKAFCGCNITTDVIVGFPGETDEDFLTTLSFVESIGFGKCHVFPYSRRKGTPADKMDYQVEKAEKHRRAKIMIDLCKKKEREYIRESIGKEDEVLFETEVEKGLFCGYTKKYIKVYSKGENLFGKIRNVKLKEPFKDGAKAEII